MNKKRCEICKKEFETKHPNRLTCSQKCSKELHRIRNREYKRQSKGGKKVVRKNEALNTKLIVDDARKARELGISYGMYKAMNWQRGNDVNV